MDNIYLFPPDDNPQKQCTGPCGRTLDATPEFFHRTKANKDGLCGRCKECRSKEGKAYRSHPEVQERKKAVYEAYYARPEIRELQQANRKAYRSRPEIKERDSARMKEYLNRPEIRAREQARKKIYRRTPEYQERQRERMNYWLNLPGIQEHLQAYRGDYYSRPEIQENLREKRRIASHNRRAIKKAVKGTHTYEQIQGQLKRQKHKCYYCHIRFKKRKEKYVYHIEHTFPLSRVAGTDTPANSIDYIVLACPTCNQSKFDKFPWEWPEGGRLL